MPSVRRLAEARKGFSITTDRSIAFSGVNGQIDMTGATTVAGVNISEQGAGGSPERRAPQVSRNLSSRRGIPAGMGGICRLFGRPALLGRANAICGSAACA